MRRFRFPVVNRNLMTGLEMPRKPNVLRAQLLCGSAQR